MIKIILKTFVLLAAVTLIACEDKPTEPYQTPSSIVPGVDDGELGIGSGDGEVGDVVAVIPVETNVEWVADVRYDNPDLGLRSGDDDDPNAWISLSPTKGRGNAEITVTAKKNREVTVRSATVVITAAKDPSCEKEVIVKQEPTSPYIRPENTTPVELGKITIDTAVLVSSNIPCDITVDLGAPDAEADWIALTGTPELVNADMQRVPIRIKTQVADVGRSGSIVFKSKEDPDNVTASVTITQNGEMKPTEMTLTNADSLFISWTGDASCVNYDIVVTKEGGEALATIPDIPYSADAIVYNLLTNSAIAAYEGIINVKVVGKTNDPGFTAASAEVSAHTVFGDGSGDGSSESTPICISAMRHLANIKTADLGKYFKQTGDIDATSWCTKNTYVPIGQRTTPFTGVYDGDNKTITGLSMANVNVNEGSTGLFGHIKGVGASVKNLNVANATMAISFGTQKYDLMVGHAIVVGVNEGGTVTKVNITNPTITIESGMASVGGVVGVNIFNGSQSAGGDPGIVSYCTTDGGSIVATGTISYVSNNGLTNIGGIVGTNWNKDCQVQHCYNLGTTVYMETGGGDVAMSSVGGVAGGSDGIIEYCKNAGDVSTDGKNAYCGGILGGIIAISSRTNPALASEPDADHRYAKSLATSVVRYCYNTGSITSGNGAYGAAGIAGSCNKEIVECYNSGTISATKGESRIHGIGGRTTCSYTDCYNTGTVISSTSDANVYVTGISGLWVSTGTVNTCYNVGQLSHSGTGGNTRCIIAAISVGQTKGGKLNNCIGLEGSAGVQSASMVDSHVSGYLYGDASKSATITGGGMMTEAAMKTASTWTSEGYSTDVWNIVDGEYPTLKRLNF